MFENLDIFRLSKAVATHAGTRQATIAQNISNADTPGYRARDLPSFGDLYDLDDGTPAFRSTRARHLNGSDQFAQTEPGLRDSGPSSPNGNNVSLELEMLHAVDVKRQHDRAVSIYKSGLNVLRTSLGRI
jgi:flagellar basal-body rod protein FlgB